MRSEISKRILSSLFLIPISLFFIVKGSFFFIFFMLIFFIISSYEWLNITKKKLFQIPGFIFLIISIYSTILLRGNSESELFIFLTTVLICVSTDIGGYVFGNIFKGPKINTKISPNKTYAGAFGGYVLSIILVYIFIKNSVIIGLDIPDNFKSDYLVWVLLISTISQAGDFLISFFKRKSNVKNTGSILPGHGGLIDRTDGMIFAIPFVYFILNIISN